MDPPRGPQRTINFLFSGLQGIIAPGRNREGAWAWVKLLQSQEGLETWAGDPRLMSQRRSLSNHPALTTQETMVRYGVRDVMLRAAESMRAEEVHAYWNDTQAETTQALQAVYAGQKTARQAMNELVPVLNEIMKRPLT